MKEYTVHWCDTDDTCGGYMHVHANNEREAVEMVRSIVKIGCKFYLVSVYPRRNNHA